MDEFSDIWIVLGAIPLYIILSLTITPVLRHRLNEKFTRQAMTQAEITKKQRILPVLNERVEALNTLQKKQYGSKIQYLELKQQLTAPVNGHVQQLAIHTEGGVVTPAQPLMMIVPEGSQLDVEAKILNKDIGFLRWKKKGYRWGING